MGEVRRNLTYRIALPCAGYAILTYASLDKTSIDDLLGQKGRTMKYIVTGCGSNIDTLAYDHPRVALHEYLKVVGDAGGRFTNVTYELFYRFYSVPDHAIITKQDIKERLSVDYIPGNKFLMERVVKVPVKMPCCIGEDSKEHIWERMYVEPSGGDEKKSIPPSGILSEWHCAICGIAHIIDTGGQGVYLDEGEDSLVERVVVPYERIEEVRLEKRLKVDEDPQCSRWLTDEDVELIFEGGDGKSRHCSKCREDEE